MVLDRAAARAAADLSPSCVAGPLAHLLQARVHLFAASVFRLALTAFLDLRFSETLPDTASDEDRGHHIASGMSFLAAQRLAEDAILIADKAPARS